MRNDASLVKHFELKPNTPEERTSAEKIIRRENDDFDVLLDMLGLTEDQVR